ncbi:hypothetical protein SAMN05443247_06439 [Bradyrhizobium erythrophlei]|nr:hypothetical protein SAMN05443247_06439 [Bradyrhizobium erythrophlei]
MKMIVAMQSIAAISVLSDTVMPENGLLQQDLINFVGDLYNFAVKPQIPPGMAGQVFPVLLYQAGKATINDSTYPINQIAVVQNGDIVTASSTEVADLILDDFLSKLDSGLGYKIGASKHKKKMYVSNMVVQFDRPIEQPDSLISKIGNLLDKKIPRPEKPFNLKRLAFGSGDFTMAQVITIEAIENADFIIERRAAADYSENIYFSSAPATTSEHLKILAQIEDEILN